MEKLSAWTSGTVIVVVGLALSLFHLWSAVRLRREPSLVLVEAAVPLVLALSVASVGALVREGGIAPVESAGRVLGWAVVGSAVLSAATGWLVADAALRGQVFPGAERAALNAATLGCLIGLVVGVYDARGERQRRRAERLTRINDTLRIATREILDATERDELEAVVCERLTDSDIYRGAWIGRYLPGDERVRPVVWAGHDDEYFEALEIPLDLDGSGKQGPGTEAIRTAEIQPVQDVFAEPTLEPWRKTLTDKDVESLAVVPFVGSERVHGFLTIYANRPNVFGAAEREALSELGESIGHAIDSIAARDRLARRERELARQNQRLDEFASLVSHDLRNPLNVADGNLELVRMDVDDDRLERVSDALGRMDELIDDLLTLARCGRTVDDVEPVDLRSVAENAWATTDTAGARFHVDGDVGTVEADRSRLMQVFENLFRNSVKHGSTSNRTESGDAGEHGSTSPRSRAPGPDADGGPSGPQSETDDPAGPTSESPAAATAGGDESDDFRRGGGPDDVTVTVGRTASGFYVADDGHGIPESEREAVFEAGYSTDDDGTGFGLDIVRTVAEAHGWRVTVGEGAAGGARFEFRTTGAEAGTTREH